MSRRLIALAAALVVTAPAPAASAERCPKTSLAHMEHQVMCLVCGVPLALADAPQAQRERVLITHMVRQCRSEDEIESALVAQYGPRVLALPQASGFRLTAYLVPAFAAAAAAAGLVVAAQRRRRRRRTASAEPIGALEPLDPEDAARIDAELERYKR